jgi:sulfur carrier protein ThiS
MEVTITVTLKGWLKRYALDGDTIRIALAEGKSVRELIKQLPVPDHPSSVTVNGAACPLDYALHKGDEVTVHPLVFGG